jgi:hypothetical protein
MALSTFELASLYTIENFEWTGQQLRGVNLRNTNDVSMAVHGPRMLFGMLGETRVECKRVHVGVERWESLF